MPAFDAFTFDTLAFDTWRPQFAVLHNTAAPKLAEWHSVPGETRMRNLETYYRDAQHWSAGPHLFVPTDAGIARIEVIAGALVQTRVFAETADIVSSNDRLVLADGGIAVARSRDSLFLQLT